MQLTGKTAIATGGASGIDAEIVRAFARESARVCIADLDFDAAQRLAEGLDGASPAIAVRMDVTDESDVQRGVDAAVGTFGGIDILVSNAGIQRLDEIVDVSLANWRRMLAVHLDGAFLTARACLRRTYAPKARRDDPGRYPSERAPPRRSPFLAHACLKA